MIAQVAELISRHQMFRPDDRVGVAVSGGADSVFLLHALRNLAPRWKLALGVIHVEHGIRGNASKQDADFVRQLAASLDLPFHFRQANVPAMDDNLEQAARRVRHAFYGELLASGQLDRIATGHTQGDQAETVLYRILRGSGLTGLAGILPVTREGLVRPLLELSRAEIEAWLRERNIEWREDETNQDRAFARNLLRHEILPLLRANFNPRLDDALANLATLAWDEERYWETELPRRQLAAGHEPRILLVAELTTVPVALARRLIRRAIESVKGDLRQIDFAHVERILEMARSQKGHDRVRLPGVDVLRSFDWVRFAAAESARDLSFAVGLSAPGSVELPDASTRITLQVLEKRETTEPYATVVNELDWQRLGASRGVLRGLELRNWRPGDQYRRVGRSNEEKIKSLFQDARIPLWERRKWPIITYNGVIVWTRCFGAAAEFAAGPSTQVVLRVAESVSGISYRSE